ncbi:hypothetical protein [Streptomyces hydrogenans]|uniref:hypothetical protein n=1 Tax=Streptomyces hydrogenans TaxID=1873719 RepID=UPI0037FF868F
MAWRYHCGNCEETGGWTSRDDAEKARAAHRGRAHTGLAPDHDELQSNAERANPKMWLYVIAACLGLWVAEKIGLLGAILSFAPEQ